MQHGALYVVMFLWTLRVDISVELYKKDPCGRSDGAPAGFYDRNPRAETLGLIIVSTLGSLCRRLLALTVQVGDALVSERWLLAVSLPVGGSPSTSIYPLSQASLVLVTGPKEYIHNAQPNFPVPPHPKLHPAC